MRTNMSLLQKCFWHLVSAAVLVIARAEGKCVVTDDLVPLGTVATCPVVTEETDVTASCTLTGHEETSGNGKVSCSFVATQVEQCPGLHCRLAWYVHRRADGTFRVVLLPTTSPHCSRYTYNAVHVSLDRCDQLYDAVACSDVIEHRDGRELFGTDVVHRCTCTGANCTRRFSSRIAVDVVKNDDDSSPFAIPVAAGVGAALGIGCGVLVAILVCRYKRRRTAYMRACQVPDKTELMTYGTPSDVQLLKCFARGRFGVVWHAMGSSEELAVKVTNEKNRASWVNECSLLSFSYMRHSSIVRFHFGEEKVTGPCCKELWLVMELCAVGSLYSYLKHNVVAWNECVGLMSSLATGVDYLHSDTGMKPEIAHRDLKSTNILIKTTPQPRCVVADFGLAVALVPGMDTSILQHQAGTPRYMAPECLASCINFKDFNSFLEADVYSLALLLWEISAACSDFAAEGAADGPRHQLPYWYLVGDQPSVREMQDIVINQRVRPPLPKGWESAMPAVKELKILAEVLADSWESEYGARLTAASVKHHMMGLSLRKVETEAAIKQAVATVATQPTAAAAACAAVPQASTSTVEVNPDMGYQEETQPPEYTEDDAPHRKKVILLAVVGAGDSCTHASLSDVCSDSGAEQPMDTSVGEANTRQWPAVRSSALAAEISVESHSSIDYGAAGHSMGGRNMTSSVSGYMTGSEVDQ